MLILRKELGFYEFMDEFSSYLEGVGREGIAIIYDALCDMMYEGNYSVVDVRDYLRFQLQHLSVGDVVHDYGYIMDGIDLEDLEAPATLEAIEDFIIEHTFLLGKYEEDGITYFIFDEF